jgi:hypothetical protein
VLPCSSRRWHRAAFAEQLTGFGRHYSIHLTDEEEKIVTKYLASSSLSLGRREQFWSVYLQSILPDSNK